MQHRKNLLLNNDFLTPMGDMPLYYIDEGGVFSYDQKIFDSQRTCSLTFSGKESCKASSSKTLSYEPFLEVSSAKQIFVSVCLRAIYVARAEFFLEFYDRRFRPIGCAVKDITQDISHDFKYIEREFAPPPFSEYFKYAINFEDQATALTLYNPQIFLQGEKAIQRNYCELI